MEVVYGMGMRSVTRVVRYFSRVVVVYIVDQIVELPKIVHVIHLTT